MGWLADTEAVLAVLVLVAVAAVIGLYVRRRLLSQTAAVFDCAMRTGVRRPSWVTGMARYRGERFEWFKVFSPSVKPAEVIIRRTARVVDRRRPESGEQVLLAGLDTVIVVEVNDPGRPARRMEIALSGGSVTGLLSWLESSPPGRGELSE